MWNVKSWRINNEKWNKYQEEVSVGRVGLSLRNAFASMMQFDSSILCSIYFLCLCAYFLLLMLKCWCSLHYHEKREEWKIQIKKYSTMSEINSHRINIFVNWFFQSDYLASLALNSLEAFNCLYTCFMTRQQELHLSPLTCSIFWLNSMNGWTQRDRMESKMKE
jgi:Ni/Fe-hydrogenase subunit HybB-like protein